MSKIKKYKLSAEELEKLLNERPILSPEDALKEEMNEINFTRWEQENKSEAAANAATSRGKGPYM